MHGGHHHDMDHFPTEAESHQLAEEFSANQPPLNPEAVTLRLDRFVEALSLSPLSDAVSDLTRPIPQLRLKPHSRFTDVIKPWLTDLIIAMGRRRIDHRALGSAQRDEFNEALQAAHADGSYQALAAIHAQPHMMHSMMGPDGTQRFLPWHRLYLLRCEDLLRQKRPGVAIPYWDYANDHNRPDWVWKPDGVTRGQPGARPELGSLPTQATITGLLGAGTYQAFTTGLETKAHNEVHNWCNGTISAPPTATQDPIFWLLHGNVDRIWDTWQLTHKGVANLSGPMAILDPWSESFMAVNDTVALRYSYG